MYSQVKHVFTLVLHTTVTCIQVEKTDTKNKTTHPKQQGWKRREEINVQGG